jgi:hypothetical protein
VSRYSVFSRVSELVHEAGISKSTPKGFRQVWVSKARFPSIFCAGESNPNFLLGAGNGVSAAFQNFDDPTRREGPRAHQLGDVSGEVSGKVADAELCDLPVDQHFAVTCPYRLFWLDGEQRGDGQGCFDPAGSCDLLVHIAA